MKTNPVGLDVDYDDADGQYVGTLTNQYVIDNIDDYNFILQIWHVPSNITTSRNLETPHKL